MLLSSQLSLCILARWTEASAKLSPSWLYWPLASKNLIKSSAAGWLVTGLDVLFGHENSDLPSPVTTGRPVRPDQLIDRSSLFWLCANERLPLFSCADSGPLAHSKHAFDRVLLPLSSYDFGILIALLQLRGPSFASLCFKFFLL